jgi:hypothetical protein
MYTGLVVEFIKLANAVSDVAQKGSSLLQKMNGGSFKNKHLIGAGLLGAGITSVGGQAIDDLRMGRMIRRQNDAQQTF